MAFNSTAILFYTGKRLVNGSLAENSITSSKPKHRKSSSLKLDRCWNINNSGYSGLWRIMWKAWGGVTSFHRQGLVAWAVNTCTSAGAGMEGGIEIMYNHHIE